MNLKYVVVIAVVVAGLSAGLTKYYFPNVQVQTKEVIKEVTVNNVTTKTHIDEKPDGSKVTTIETIDKSINKTTDNKSETKLAQDKQWMVDLGVRLDVNAQIYYDLQVQRRILGPFFLGAKLSTDRSIGLSVGMEF